MNKDFIHIQLKEQMEDQVGISTMQLEEGNSDVSQCPFMGGFYFTSISPASENASGTRKRLSAQRTYKTSILTNEIVIESRVPPSPRLVTLLAGLNVPGDSGNPPEPPPWLDRQLFDRGREFYRRYLFCLSFSDLLSLVLMLSTDRALRPLIYTGQSDTPHKALKRYFSTLLHIVTWYKGDVWDPEDTAYKDIMAIRSVHGKVARLCNSSEENEKVTHVQVSERGHKEPPEPLYTSIRKDLRPYVEAKITVMNPDDPRHYISQLDMSLTQYSFMGLLVAHPEKIGAGAATEEEFAGLIHFWRGIGWLLGMEDKYNFCSGNVAETRALCLEVERMLAIPFLSEVDWNYEHMATSLMSGMHIIIPSLSFPTMFRYLAHTMGISVPSFVKRMSFQHCFYYWFMRFIFGLMVFFPNTAKVLSSRFGHMIGMVQGKSGKNGTCPKGAIVLTKNYS